VIFGLDWRQAGSTGIWHVARQSAAFPHPTATLTICGVVLSGAPTTRTDERGPDVVGRCCMRCARELKKRVDTVVRKKFRHVGGAP
jgi:hypothetical protein